MGMVVSGRATYDVRRTRPTCDNATCDGRKSKSRDVARACRMSHVARPVRAPDPASPVAGPARGGGKS